MNHFAPHNHTLNNKRNQSYLGMATEIKQWLETRNGKEYLISTDPSLIDRDLVNKSFASDDLYWAKPLSPEQIELMITQSQNFGLYEILPNSVPPAKTPDSPSSPRTPSPTVDGDDNDTDGDTSRQRSLKQIGYARLITDYTTIAYLTDVFIIPEFRKLGFSTLLMKCCREVLEAMPVLRRGWLVATPGAAESFYERELGFGDFAKYGSGNLAMTRRFDN